jgi:hypothetical protein
VNEKTGSRKVVLLIATILSAIMLAATSILSLSPATAFAQHVEPADNLLGQLNVDPNINGNLAENIVEDKSVTVEPTIQVSTQTAINVNNDNDVAFSEGCADISDDDEVTQTNRQAANQVVVHKDSEVGDGGVVVEPTTQLSTQTATNVNNDNDVYIVLGCDDDDSNLEISDDDEVTQLNEQIANQVVVHKDSEVGDGGVVVDPTIQRSTQTATNYNEDNDRVVLV